MKRKTSRFAKKKNPGFSNVDIIVGSIGILHLVKSIVNTAIIVTQAIEQAKETGKEQAKIPITCYRCGKDLSNSISWLTMEIDGEDRTVCVDNCNQINK